MITTMRGCVAYNDLWPWPISSRSFGLDLENRVRSVASKVMDGFFLYLAQMVTIIRGCVTCYVFFRIWKFEKKSTVLHEFFPYLAQMITSMRGCLACNDLWPWPISSRSFGLGLENRVHFIASTVLDGFWGGWGCEVSCGGHHRPTGKTTTGSALDGAVFDIAQILAYQVHDMSRSQLYLGFGHFVWLPSFFGQ